MNFSPSPYALVIIDMQNDFVERESPLYIQQAASSIPNIRKILDFFRNKNWPIFHIIRTYRKDGSNVEGLRLPYFLQGHQCLLPYSHGWQIVDDLSPRDNEYVVTKPRFSAFMATELDFLLRRLQAEYLVICGTQLPVCVRQTLFDALAYDYSPVLITDGCSAKEPEIATANIRDIVNIGVLCLTANEFISMHE